MSDIAPNKVESVLLYQDFEKIDPLEILQFVNSCIDDDEHKFSIEQSGRFGEFVLMCGGGLYVLVSQSARPFELDRFGSTLASPYTKLTFKNAAEIVSQHSHHIHISVGSGMPMAGTPELLGSLNMAAPVQTQEEFELKLAYCQSLTGFIARNRRPSAIHWLQSDTLLTPENFLMLTSDPFPVRLFVHPNLFSSRNIINGTPVLGLRTHGASHLIGHEIIFIEAPVPLIWLFERTSDFINLVREHQSILPDGDTFGKTLNEVIRVRHRPASEERPNGEIELMLEQSDEFSLVETGMPAKDPEPVAAEPEILLDENDPIDRAILERLKDTGNKMREAVQTEPKQAADTFPVDNKQASFGHRGSKLFH